MYRIIISQSALKELARLQRPVVRKVGEAIDEPAENPKPAGIKKLKGQKEDLYRIRVGDYRVIYSIEEEIKIIDVRKIGPRKDIYRDL